MYKSISISLRLGVKVLSFFHKALYRIKLENQDSLKNGLKNSSLDGKENIKFEKFIKILKLNWKIIY